MIRLTIYTLPLLLAGMLANAAPLDCDIQRLCTNDTPCQAVSLRAKILPIRDSLLLSLGAEPPVVLASHEASGDVLLRGSGRDAAGATATMLSLYADLTLAYSVHSFDGQNVALTMFGTCKMEKT